MTPMIAPFALVLTLTLTASQPPAPSSGNKEGKPQPQQAQQTQTQPAPVPSGTDANPLVIRETRSEAQAAEDKQDRRNQQTDRRYGLWLSVVTTLVIAFQVWLLIQQNKIIKNQTSVMQLQERAASSSAIAAKAQTEHMLAGLEETRKAAIAASKHMTAQLTAAQTGADAALRSAVAAENALRIVDRAYIQAVNWKLTDIDDARGPIWHCEVLNSGNTPALLIKMSAGQSYGVAPLSPSLEKLQTITGGNYLAAGARMTSDVRLNPGREHSGFSFKAITDDKGTIYCFIYVEIVYTDRFEPDRHRTFRTLRRYDVESKKFVSAPSAAYDYAD